MTTFLIAAITADGFIAKNPGHVSRDWTSKEDKKFLIESTKRAGVVVMGLNTYRTMRRPFPDRLNIVYSDTKENLAPDPTDEWASKGGPVEATQAEPADLLKDLESRGYEESAIVGGATIYTMFMEAGLIDKLYLTIEPIIFGSGMHLFNKDLEINLTLDSVQKLGEQTILLEYSVVRL